MLEIQITGLYCANGCISKLFAIARTLVGGGVRGEGNGGRREIEKTNTRKWWENG